MEVSRDPGLRNVPWGVCPAPGVTLRAGGNRAWCTAPGCEGEWDYDRLHTPCAEPATAVVTDEDGATGKLCAAHARDAGDRLHRLRPGPLDPERLTKPEFLAGTVRPEAMRVIDEG
ncbi:hypothetical protein [Amycolatopsis sp. WQ 127309]|uniref:hypothetical protein n=1 Tax=Amycolatopsis sp. WQ 127309 TaxID=2932773 RepID=UPI001FF1676C|nr:hypothetical protein [Amycolatopsis sp. WQ 127309]UOZ03348.1 hypothetical protein MUY22_31400 [Amycolatopsis sp. WQ 127309]